MSRATAGGPSPHFGHNHDGNHFGAQTQDVSPSTIRALSHEQLVVNPLYFNLLQEQASLTGKIDLLQSMLDHARPLQGLGDTSGQGFPGASAGAMGGLPSMTTHGQQHTIPVHASGVGSPFGALTPAYNPSVPLSTYPLQSDSQAAYLRLPARSGRKRSDYPNIKYWSKEEAMNDPAAHKNPNVRKPTLKVVLERLDGTQVDDNRFADIQSTVRAACSRFLDLSLSYTKQTPSAQDAYIAYVESVAPELSYCDESGWKAVMMARTFIDGKTRRGRDSTAPSGTSRGRKGKKKDQDTASPDEETPVLGEDEIGVQESSNGRRSPGGGNKRRRVVQHQEHQSPEEYDLPVPQLDQALAR